MLPIIFNTLGRSCCQLHPEQFLLTDLCWWKGYRNLASAGVYKEVYHASKLACNQIKDHILLTDLLLSNCTALCQTFIFIKLLGINKTWRRKHQLLHRWNKLLPPTKQIKSWSWWVLLSESLDYVQILLSADDKTDGYWAPSYSLFV